MEYSRLVQMHRKAEALPGIMSSPRQWWRLFLSCLVLICLTLFPCGDSGATEVWSIAQYLRSTLGGGVGEGWGKNMLFLVFTKIGVVIAIILRQSHCLPESFKGMGEEIK